MNIEHPLNVQLNNAFIGYTADKNCVHFKVQSPVLYCQLWFCFLFNYFHFFYLCWCEICRLECSDIRESVIPNLVLKYLILEGPEPLYYVCISVCSSVCPSVRLSVCLSVTPAVSGVHVNLVGGKKAKTQNSKPANDNLNYIRIFVAALSSTNS